MPRILVKFFKIKLDKGRFTEYIASKTIDAMRISGYQAFRITYRLVPVWTGESRGGLGAIALQLELGDSSSGAKSGLYNELMSSISPVNDKPRYREDGVRKSPISAPMNAEGPIRRVGNRIDFSFKNDAEGFAVGDKHSLRNSPTAPWGFSKTFLREWRKNLHYFLVNRPDIGIKQFSSLQRVSN